MNISDKLKQFLKDNEEELSKPQPDYSKLYEELKMFSSYDYIVGKFTNLLHASGINPLENLDYVPEDFLCGSSITEFKIPNHIKSIRSGAFFSCKNLIDIEIPDSVTSIGYYAFLNCSSLKEIIIPDSVTSIGNDTFRDCRSLTSVTIGDSVTSIGYDAFHNCTSLTSIRIGKNVTTIEPNAFENCNNLRDIYYNGTKEDRDRSLRMRGREDEIHLREVTWHYNS